ncbi:cell division protein ZipA [Gammaproteobacteria bacterium 53_120_T64]|nr:cell division protein ZipA [Gammaproteobacteria bacterium 53_120_T64]
MELGSREILLALGGLLIVAILLDGLRRVRSAGRGKLRVKRRRQPIFDDDDFDEYGSELPSGKARVVSVRGQGCAAELSQTIKSNRESDASRLTSPFRQMDAESVASEALNVDASGAVIEPVLERAESESGCSSELAPELEAPAEVANQTQTPLFKNDASADDAVLGLTDDLQGQKPSDKLIAVPSIAAQQKNRDKVGKDSACKSRGNKGRPGRSSPQAAAKSGEDVVILHLMAEPGREFDGEALLKAVVENGLRYGSLKIFHRHVREDGSGDVLFSMANAVNPGTFELLTMGEFSTPGVTFMMVLDDSEDPLVTFDLMLGCIHGVNSALGGLLQDQQRSALSRQTAEHYRQQIMDFNRRRLTASV